MNNQASEIDTVLDNYEAFLLKLNDETSKVNLKLVARQGIKQLIRTEKLKLLTEVRERVIGRNQPLPKRGDVDPDIYVEVIHRVEGRNALRAEQINLLTKLEAEL